MKIFMRDVLICFVVLFISLAIIFIISSAVTNDKPFSAFSDLEGEFIPLDTAKRNIDTLLIENLPISLSYVFGNYFDIDDCTYIDTVKSMIVEEDGENYIIWVRKEQ